MRIGIDARFYGGEQSKGLGRYTQKLIHYLLTIDQESEYVIFLHPEAYATWISPRPGVTAIRAPFPWYSVSEQLAMPWLIWRAKVDLMHFPHFNVPLLYRGPFVVTIHDLIILRFPTSRATTLGPWLYRLKHLAGSLVMRHAALRARHIITVSEFSKRDLMNYYHLPTDRISVTYEATDEVKIDALSTVKTNEVLRQYGIQKPYVLYIGNAYPHKNLEVLLDMMKLAKKRFGTPPWQLVLVGKMDYFYDRLQHAAWSRAVEDVVLFPGFVPDRDLSVLYQEAAVYLFPSLYEGFGLPALEAMAHGTPVIAARASCLPEILGDAAYYVDPDDPFDMIEAVHELIENPVTRQQLQTAGLQHIKHFSWHAMSQATHDIYQSFASPTKSI